MYDHGFLDLDARHDGPPVSQSITYFRHRKPFAAERLALSTRRKIVAIICGLLMLAAIAATAMVPELFSSQTGNFSAVSATDYIFQPGTIMLSPNRQFRLVLTNSGRLELFDENRTIYRAESLCDRLIFQMGDGHLTCWWGEVAQYSTLATGGSELQLTDDGDLVIYNNNGRAIWHLSEGFRQLDNSSVRDIRSVISNGA
jgi:hypothetical protein